MWYYSTSSSLHPPPPHSTHILARCLLLLLFLSFGWALFFNLSFFWVVGVTQIISSAICIHQFLFQFYFQLRFAGSPLRYFNIMDLTNHGNSFVESQPTESSSAVGVMTGFHDSFCIQGHLKRRGPEDKTIDNVESQRRRVARGPVSLAEIRRNPNAMYTWAGICRIHHDLYSGICFRNSNLLFDMTECVPSLYIWGFTWEWRSCLWHRRFVLVHACLGFSEFVFVILICFWQVIDIK